MDKDYYIYAHLRGDKQGGAREGSVFYIGRGSADRAWGAGRNAYWRRTVEKYGHSVVILASGLELDDANALETEIIDALWGMTCNLAPGGIGTGAGVRHPRYGSKHSDSARSKISVANSGLKRTDEVRTAQSAQRKGQKRSAEFCANQSVSRRGASHPMFGRKLAPEHRAALCAASRTQEAEERRSLTRALRSPERVAEIRAAISAATKGKPKTPETRAKMRAAAALRVQRQAAGGSRG